MINPARTALAAWIGAMATLVLVPTRTAAAQASAENAAGGSNWLGLVVGVLLLGVWIGAFALAIRRAGRARSSNATGAGGDRASQPGALGRAGAR